MFLFFPFIETHMTINSMIDLLYFKDKAQNLSKQGVTDYNIVTFIV